MPRFDSAQYDPPAPMATVQLRALQGSAKIENVALLIDTGADVTLIPTRAVDQIGATGTAGETIELLAFDGRPSSASIVTLDLVFLGRIFRGRYLLIDRDHGILGRVVLNHVRLLLDGPRQHWDELTS